MKCKSIRFVCTLVVITLLLVTGIIAIPVLRQLYAAAMLEYVVTHPVRLGETYNDDFAREEVALDRVRSFRAEEQAKDRLIRLIYASPDRIRMKSLMCLGAMAEYNESSMVSLKDIAYNPATPKDLADEATDVIDYFTFTATNVKGYLGSSDNNGKSLFYVE